MISLQKIVTLHVSFLLMSPNIQAMEPSAVKVADNGTSQVNYTLSPAKSLKEACISKIVEVLTQDSSESLEMLKALGTIQLESEVKEALINTYRVLLCDVFNDQLPTHTLYSGCSIYDMHEGQEILYIIRSGEFTANGDGFIILLVDWSVPKKPVAYLDLWMVDDLEARPEEKNLRDRKMVPFNKDQSDGVYVGILKIKRSQNNDCFLVRNTSHSWQIWDLQDTVLQYKMTLRVEVEPQNITISPDGGVLVMCSRKLEFPMFVSLEKLLAAFKGKEVSLEQMNSEGHVLHEKQLYNPNFSDGGDYLFACEVGTNVIMLWEVRGCPPKLIKKVSWEGEVFGSLWLDRRGRYMLVVAESSNSAFLKDLSNDSCKPLAASGHKKYFEAVRAEGIADGRLAFMVLPNEQILLYDLIEDEKTAIKDFRMVDYNRRSLGPYPIVIFDTYSRHMLYLNKYVHSISLQKPMIWLSLPQLLVIIKLKKYGKEIVKGEQGLSYLEELNSLLACEGLEGIAKATKEYFEL